MIKEDADSLNDAIKQAMSERGYFVTRSIVVCEAINPDGERTITCVGTDDLRTWEAVGMLDYAREIGMLNIHGELDHGDE